jgi:hypothetical protein
MIHKKAVIAIGISDLTIFFSCTKNKEENIANQVSSCDTNKTISFKTDVQPILNNNCGAQSGCHSNGSASGGVKLEAWEGTNEVAKSGLLMKAIQHESGVSAMPKGGNKIDNCYIGTIAKWVKNGSLNN